MNVQTNRFTHGNRVLTFDYVPNLIVKMYAIFSYRVTQSCRTSYLEKKVEAAKFQKVMP